MEIAREFNLFVIDDAAHAFPSRYRENYVGNLAHASCFSFYATKTLTTGEGGMVTTSNGDWAERIGRLRLHGISKTAWKRYSEQGSWSYDVTEPGYKYNTTDMASAMGLVQLGKTEFTLNRRKAIAEKYTEAFDQSELIEPYMERAGCNSSWHLYCPKLNLDALKISRDEFLQRLDERGVATSLHFIPLYRFTALKDMGIQDYKQEFPNCEYVFERVFSLPIYPDLQDEEVDYIVEVVLQTLEENRR